MYRLRKENEKEWPAIQRKAIIRFQGSQWEECFNTELSCEYWHLRNQVKFWRYKMSLRVSDTVIVNFNNYFSHKKSKSNFTITCQCDSHTSGKLCFLAKISFSSSLFLSLKLKKLFSKEIHLEIHGDLGIKKGQETQLP